MSKDQKLKRYKRKDYRELVEFPVEIVGRDGSVRRYDFHEAVRLYQRRMSFAPLRFQDDDLAAAEQEHCESRIGQLRRSYFESYGWTAGPSEHGPEAGSPELAGELTSFFARVLRTPVRPVIRFTRLESPTLEPGGQLWWLDIDGIQAGLLLYAYVFQADPTTLAAYHEQLSTLKSSLTPGDDVETLVASHYGRDFGFVLTGRAADVSMLVALVPDQDEGAEDQGERWDEVVEFVRKGDYPTAFARCRWLVRHQPWHRDAYVAGAMLGNLLRQHADAEDLAFVGLGYFPQDGLLHHYLGLSRLHQGRRGEAVAALRQAVVTTPDMVEARSLLLVALIEQWRWLATLREASVEIGERRSRAHQLHRALVRFVWFAVAYGSFVCVLCAATYGALTTFGQAAFVPAAFVLGLAAFGATSLRAQFTQLTQRLRFEDSALAMRRLRRRRARLTEATSPQEQTTEC